MKFKKEGKKRRVRIVRSQDHGRKDGEVPDGREVHR